jgi:hypothetical protein
MKPTTHKKRLLINSLFTLLMIVLVLALPMISNGQVDPPPGPVGGSNPDANVPIDGGLSLVLAAGVGYGAKKIRDYNKKKREENEF